MENEPKFTGEPKPTDLSAEFASMDSSDFRRLIRRKLRENPAATFSIVTNWANVQTARRAKAFLDDRNLRIASITIRATRSQYHEDVNAFQSGVKWEEI